MTASLLRPAARCLVTLILVFLAWASAGVARAAGELQLSTPSPAPPLVLTDLAGRPLDLARYRGKLVLVNFWATYCKPCREEMPSLDRLRNRLAPRGFEVVGIDVAEDAATVTRFLATTPVSFPVALDGEGGVMGRWKAVALPTTFVVDRRGRLRGRLTGGADWESGRLVGQLEALMTEP